MLFSDWSKFEVKIRRRSSRHRFSDRAENWEKDGREVYEPCCPDPVIHTSFAMGEGRYPPWVLAKIRRGILQTTTPSSEVRSIPQHQQILKQVSCDQPNSSWTCGDCYFLHRAYSLVSSLYLSLKDDSPSDGMILRCMVQLWTNLKGLMTMRTENALPWTGKRSSFRLLKWTVLAAIDFPSTLNN